MKQIVNKMESGGQYDLLQRYLETDRMKARNLVVNVAVSALIDMRRLVFLLLSMVYMNSVSLNCN